MTVEEQKRKGRKKKELINKEEQTNEVTIEKKQNKRGRKVKVVEFKKIDTLPSNNFTLQETFILHLPISLNMILENNLDSKKGIENILTEKPIIPLPYNSVGYNMSGKENIKETENKKQKNNKQKDAEDIKVFTSVDNEGRKMTTTVYTKTILPTDSTDKEVRVSAQKTNVACWWCCHQFDTYPVCAPVKYNESKDIFRVVGCFCSFNCAKSYSMQNKRCISLNSFLYKRIMGKLEYVKPAPSKTVLNMFGGPLTIEEYRSTFNTLSTINSNVFPMVFFPTQVEYNKIDDSFKMHRSSISKTALDTHNVEIANKRISNKKQPVTKNNLLNLMGITVKNN